MAHSKQKVIIDLAEYNELLEAQKKLEAGIAAEREDVNPYAKAISAMLGVLGHNNQMIRVLLDAPVREEVEMNVSRTPGGNYLVHCRMKLFKSPGINDNATTIST